MAASGRMGHTGQKVQEPGTYVSRMGAKETYAPGDVFREEPGNTGKHTVWEKTNETNHPGGSR